MTAHHPLPCPFCGGTDLKVREEGSCAVAARSCYVACTTCGAGGPNIPYRTEGTAVCFALAKMAWDDWAGIFKSAAGMYSKAKKTGLASCPTAMVSGADRQG